MKIHPSRGVGLVLLSFLLAAASVEAAQATEENAPWGVVVQNVHSGYTADRAGIRPGDVLLSWERAPDPPVNPGSAKGVFLHPFEARLVEWEQGERGRFLIAGLRDGRPIVFELRGGDEWRIEMRPLLDAGRLRKLERAQGLLAGGAREEAVALWNELTAGLAAAGRPHDGAWLRLNLAVALTEEGEVGQGVAALDRAIELIESAGDPAALGLLVRQRALLRQTSIPLEETLEAYSRVRDLWAESPPSSGAGDLSVAVALNDLGLTAWRMGDQEKARRLFEQSLVLRRKHVPESGAVVNSLLNLATAASLEDAERLLERARSLLTPLAPEGHRMTSVLNNLAKIAYEKGHLRDCLAHAEEALGLARRHGEEGGISLLLANLSEVAQLRGDLATAEIYSQEATELLLRASPTDRASHSAVDNLLTIGDLARVRGDLTKAQTTLELALKMERALASDSPRLPSILVSLAGVALERGEIEKAESLLSLATSKAIFESPSSETIDLLTKLASVEHRLGRAPAALRHLERAARSIPEGIPHNPVQAEALARLGRLFLDAGEVGRAERLFKRALAAQEEKIPGTVAVASSHHGLGLVAWRRGEMARASAYLRAAVEAVESQRERIGGDYESRARFNSQTARLYRDSLKLAIETGRPALAFELSERARARAFLDLLAARHLSFAEIDPDLDARLEAANVAYDRALSRARRGSPTRQTEADDALRRLAEARGRRHEVSTRIRAAAPRPHALRNPRPLNLDEVRRALDPGTLLLSYVVTEQETFVFAVGAEAEAFEAHPIPLGEEALGREVERFRAGLGPQGGADFSWPWSQRLGEALLGPVRQVVAAADRLLILADGPLHDLPFAALSDPSAPGRYVIEGRPVSLALSATSFAEIRARASRRESLSVVAFGDPQYPAPASADDGGRRGLRSSVAGRLTLDPLPETRLEVEELGALFPGSTLYLGAEATEDRVKTVDRETAILHLACHGITDERFPLESALALSSPSAQGRGKDNGLLQAWEIFEQVRLDADLVTLSACDTARGEKLAGEGMIGLTRAFQYAGARSVLASLWAVADGSTADLMRDFYGHVSRGVELDEALRRAQMAMIRAGDPGRSAARPFHWAAFQLHGDAVRPVGVGE